MSLTDILRDRDEGEGWSNCSSRLPSHLTLGSSMALTSPQVGAWSPSHKKSQKVTKSHHESLAANNSAVTVPQHDGNQRNASPEKRHSSSLSRTPPAVASYSRVMSKSQNDTRVYLSLGCLTPLPQSSSKAMADSSDQISKQPFGEEFNQT